MSIEDIDDLVAPGGLDNRSSRPNHVPMNAPTREEIDAKLATIEAKMDGRLARIEDALAHINTSVDKQKSSTWQAAAVIIGSIIATVALAFASFDSGRETAKIASEAQTKATQANVESAAALRNIEKISEAIEKVSLKTPPK